MNPAITGPEAADIVRQDLHFLLNVLRQFGAGDATFAPCPGMMTVAQQVRHIAITTEWFIDGGFGVGFSMDFDEAHHDALQAGELADEMQHNCRVQHDFASMLETIDSSQLLERMPKNPILGEVPRYRAIFANSDHIAHHRGALTVYLRLLGIEPAMVYTD